MSGGRAGAEPVVIVDTGVANIASLRAAFRRLGRETELSRDPERVAAARYVVLPGVGAFAAGMARLRAADLATPLRQRVADGRPLLAVCLGLQLLAAESAESPGVAGLGVVPASVTRFPGGVRVPQFGWNEVRPDSGMRLLLPGFAYFANSYRLAEAPAGFAAAWADHGGPFVAALERGALLACQFHPELSSAWGAALLGRWLEAASC